jgi:hypothetical protein
MGLIGSIRKALYGSAKTLGDVQAVRKRKIVTRIKNRILGKISGKILGKL